MTEEPAGMGSLRTTQLMSDWASTSRTTRTTSPRLQRPLAFFSTAVTVFLIR